MKTAALPAHVPVEENCQSKHGALPLMEIRCGSNAAGGGECAQLLPVPDSLLVPITERENGLVKYEGGGGGGWYALVSTTAETAARRRRSRPPERAPCTARLVSRNGDSTSLPEPGHKATACWNLL
jgi:hypothetical protein